VDKSIETAVKDFILREFLPGENADELTEATPLITGGILDSLATLKLVAFLEDHYSVTLRAHEADVENLNTLADIGSLVRSKL